MATADSSAEQLIKTKDQKAAADQIRELEAKEAIFAVVGPVGSGTSEIANALDDALSKQGYQSTIIKVRSLIKDWAVANERRIDEGDKIAEVVSLQDAGDAMRFSDHAAVAVSTVREIREARARQLGKPLEPGKALEPDETPRAYIIDSLRHPAEVHLLRSVYQESFCLIGVVCEEDDRKSRLRKKYEIKDGDEDGERKLADLMTRDANAIDKNGQHVADTFHLADFFIDNTEPRLIEESAGSAQEGMKPNPDWIASDELGRLVDILTHTRIHRPRPNEKAMFHAFGAQMRSSCLSRQVGAALMNDRGDIVATGTNEVPRAGGGVYGDVFGDRADVDPDPKQDHRCFKYGGYCRNTREQIDIVKDLLTNVEEFSSIEQTPDLIRRLRKTRIGQLIEFSRAVHAEMEVLLSAARQGTSTQGLRLFVTTFPCHNCARHIVAAGVDEVQFIEPYLKSRALPLHGDAIATSKRGWTPPSLIDAEAVKERSYAPQVLFHPFTGVAPRLYRRAFHKDRSLKDDDTGDMLQVFGMPEGSAMSRVSYAQIEAALDSAASRTLK